MKNVSLVHKKYFSKFKNYGGPLYYFGNRNLTLPDANGHMRVDPKWLKDSFSIILENRDGRGFEHCFEPFAGSASWSFTAIEIGFSKEYWINDGNGDLIHFFRLVKSKPNLVKKFYEDISHQYQKTQDQETFFIDTICKYNSTDLEERSLILPFIVNHSWGGMVFYDHHSRIIYRKINQSTPGSISSPSLSLENFFSEIDRISFLLNRNTVHLQSGDFADTLNNLSPNDFVVLNPPYPENERSLEEKVGLYVEMHSPDTLHKKLIDWVNEFERKDITYFMSYGLHSSMENFLIRKKDYFLRLIGSEKCIFGKALDRTYMNIGFTIPSRLNHLILPADELLQGRTLDHKEALEQFTQRQVCGARE